MKAREISQDGQRRFALPGFGDDTIHRFHQRRQVLKDFGDADDGHFFVIRDDFDSGCLHQRAAHAENLHVQASLQGRGELRRVHISGSFTG